MSESQLKAVAEVALEQQQQQQWSQDTELLAGIFEVLQKIAHRLDAGLLVGFPKDGKLPAPQQMQRLTRPAWVKEAEAEPTSDHAGSRVVSPSEFFAMFRGRR